MLQSIPSFPSSLIVITATSCPGSSSVSVASFHAVLHPSKRGMRVFSICMQPSQPAVAYLVSRSQVDLAVTVWFCLGCLLFPGCPGCVYLVLSKFSLVPIRCHWALRSSRPSNLCWCPFGFSLFLPRLSPCFTIFALFCRVSIVRFAVSTSIFPCRSLRTCEFAHQKTS